MNYFKESAKIKEFWKLFLEYSLDECEWEFTSFEDGVVNFEAGYDEFRFEISVISDGDYFSIMELEDILQMKNIKFFDLNIFEWNNVKSYSEKIESVVWRISDQAALN